MHPMILEVEVSYRLTPHIFGRWKDKMIDRFVRKVKELFEKKEIIFSETLGVCQVAELPKLSAKNGEQVLYYGLRSVYDKSKVSYIPVEHHQVLLRPLISYEEAKKLSEAMPEKITEQQKQEIEYVIHNKKH